MRFNTAFIASFGSYLRDILPECKRLLLYLCLGAFIYFGFPQDMPTGYAKTCDEFISHWSVPGLAFGCVYLLAAAIQVRTSRFWVIGWFTAMCGYVLYISTARYTLHSIPEVFNQFIALALIDPAETLAVSVGAVVLVIAFRSMTVGGRDMQASSSSSYRAATLVPAKSSVPSRRQVTIHEAGHALMHTLLENTPQKMTVYAPFLGFTKSGSRGSVGAEYSIDCQLPGVLYWKMCRDLAGAVAESVCLGCFLTGSSADNDDWSALARYYLHSGFGEVWLSGSYPSSIEHNRTVLNALREEQRSAVREFLEANRTLLEEIAAEIDLKELLGLPEMLPYFSRVVFTLRMQKNVGTP